jgi:hypothetical protein
MYIHTGTCMAHASFAGVCVWCVVCVHVPGGYMLVDMMCVYTQTRGSAVWIVHVHIVHVHIAYIHSI